MKVKNVSTLKVFLKDLKFVPESQTEGRRGEDRYLAPGASVYLPDTSEVIRSAHKGDLRKFKDSGVLDLQDTVTLAPAASTVISHGFKYPPTTTVLKQVGATWVDATGTVDVVHNDTFTTTTITNPTGGSLVFMIKIY